MIVIWLVGIAIIGAVIWLFPGEINDVHVSTHTDTSPLIHSAKQPATVVPATEQDQAVNPVTPTPVATPVSSVAQVDAITPKETYRSSATQPQGKPDPVDPSLLRADSNGKEEPNPQG
ncbi:hypothetical protein [Stomatohabitans albus]